MFRMYVDEVGSDDLIHVSLEDHRFLSLTGVIINTTHARDVLQPNMEWIKAHIFDHDPDSPLIFHRTDIVRKKREFGVLRDCSKLELFDKSLLRLFQTTEYVVITAVIDKLGMMKQQNWNNQHPYHYLMEILVEKYVQFLERHNMIGDIMPEGRKGKKDTLLQKSFEQVKKHGTYYISSKRIHSAIRGSKLKFRYKRDNISGLQLCDLIAHPSHMYVRHLQRHEINLGPYAERIIKVLVDSKYDRSKTGTIRGYGIKYLP